MVWSNEESRHDSTQGNEVFSSQKKKSRFSRAPISYSEGCGGAFREGTAEGVWRCHSHLFRAEVKIKEAPLLRHVFIASMKTLPSYLLVWLALSEDNLELGRDLSILTVSTFVSLDVRRNSLLDKDRCFGGKYYLFF